ncbi:MAG: FkbM family methyltransferase [Thermonemataceae bacterium]
MNLNTIRKLLFTNIFAERTFITLLKANILTSFVNKLLPSNTLYRKETIRKVKRNEIAYALDISDYQSWLIYFLSDEDTSLKMLTYLENAEIILDIGANIGQTALEINKDRQKHTDSFHIICFEPYPENYTKLQINFKLNETQHIKAEKLGLGIAPKKVRMYKDCATNSGGNRMVYNASENTLDVEEVEITSLDNYLTSNNLHQVDFIKIDVEGYEYEVLKGATNTLKQIKPKLFIELDDQNLKHQGSSAYELISFLEGFDYSIRDVEDKYTEDQLKTMTVHTDIYCE